MTITINSHSEFDPLRSIMFGNIENSYNIPKEFPCQTLDLECDGYLKSYFPYIDRLNEK